MLRILGSCLLNSYCAYNDAYTSNIYFWHDKWRVFFFIIAHDQYHILILVLKYPFYHLPMRTINHVYFSPLEKEYVFDFFAGKYITR